MRTEVFETLRHVLRARKMTYADLADRLRVSEPTIKRLFASRDAKLSRIASICDALDLSLEDVIGQSKRRDQRPVTLGDRVELQLADDPGCFYLFILLREGLSQSDIAAQFGLSDAALFRLGQKLDRLGLAQMQTSGRIALTVTQPIDFRRDGPLHRMLLRLNLDFITGVFLAQDTETSAFLTQSRRISRQTAAQVMTDLRDINRKLSTMARQDQLTLTDAELHSHKLCVAWAPVAFADLAQIDG